MTRRNFSNIYGETKKSSNPRKVYWNGLTVTSPIETHNFLFLFFSLSSTRERHLIVPYLLKHWASALKVTFNRQLKTSQKNTDSVDTSNSTGSDVLPPCLPKWLETSFSKTLWCVLRQTKQVRKFLNQFKGAQIVPIFKSGDKIEVSIYRTVALLQKPARFLKIVSSTNSYQMFEPVSVRSSSNSVKSILQLFVFTCLWDNVMKDGTQALPLMSLFSIYKRRSSERTRISCFRSFTICKYECTFLVFPRSTSTIELSMLLLLVAAVHH